MATPEHNQHMVRRYFEEAYNGQQDHLLHDLFHPEFADYSQHPGAGPALAKHMVDFERSVFPDIHFRIEDMVANDDDVVVRVTVQGTHGGAFLGIAPTGRRAEFIGLQRIRFQDGRISRIVWHHYDKLRMLKQLGVVDLPPQIAGT